MPMPDSTRFAVTPFADCANEVISFRNRNRDQSRAPNYFDWRYLKRPCHEGAFVVWAADGAGRKIGAASIVPHDFCVLGQMHPLGIIGDISVLPEQRGRGIAKRMMEFLRQHPAMQALRASVVLPNDEAAGPLLKGGWRTVTASIRYVRLLDLHGRLERRLGRLGARASPWANAVLRWSTAEAWTPTDAAYTGMERMTFDERYNELWARIDKSAKIMAARTSAYLRWRYTDHPLVRHRIFELRRAGQLIGYFVFHVDGDSVHIDDFLVADDAAGRHLIARFLQYARAEKLGGDVQLRVSRDTFLALPWRRFGFLRRADQQRVMVAEGGAATPGLYDATAWFMTAGDKDV